MDPDSTQSDDSSKSVSRIIYGLWIALSFLCVVALATGLLPLLPVDLWWIRIGDFPRLQLLIAYLVLMGLLLFFRKRLVARIYLGLLAICVGIQLYWIFSYLPIAPIEVEAAQEVNRNNSLRLYSANVLQKNKQSDLVLSMIEQVDPDVIVLLEVNQRWIDELSFLDEKYPHRKLHPLENTYGIAMYSKLEFVSAEVRGIVKPEIPSIDAVVKLRSGHQVRLFAIHPNPPRPGEDTTKRDAELVLVGREVRNDPSVVVLGDLNDVGWSRTTNLFQEVSGLLDPRKGRGLFPTYNATSLLLRYPLDHLFHSDDFRLVEIKTLDDIGSDHFPLMVELSHEPAAKSTQEGPDLDPDDVENAAETVENLKENPE